MKKTVVLKISAVIFAIFLMIGCSDDDKDSAGVAPDRDPATEVTLDKSSISLGIGSTVQLNVSILPDNATNNNVSWWSSTNQGVASVNNSGLVTGIAGGDALITIVTADGYSADCQVHVLSWTHPSSPIGNVSSGGEDAHDPRVAMDNLGNTIIVWSQFDGSNDQIFMSEYRNNTWTHPEDLSDNISPSGENTNDIPQVAIDNNGNAIIVWSQFDGSNDQIFMSEYRNNTWTHPEDLSDNISPSGENAHNPQVAMDDNGNAIIVWSQFDGSNDQIFRSKYSDNTWTHPEYLSDNISPDGESALVPQVAMDNNDNAIIVWRQFDGSNNQIFMSDCRNNIWTHPKYLTDNISPSGENAYDHPQVTMDNNGNAIIVWRQYYGLNSQIFKSEYRNSTWRHPANPTDHISPSGESAYDPQVSMDNNGNAIIVWRQSDGHNSQIFMSEYRNNVWRYPENLSDNICPSGGDTYEFPQVAMDDNGNAIIVWSQYSIYWARHHIFMSEYRNNVWKHPEDLHDTIVGTEEVSYELPRVAMDNNGNAIIVWPEEYTNSNIYRSIIMSEYR